eukprot:4668271-Amphidinium_carterae.1
MFCPAKCHPHSTTLKGGALQALAPLPAKGNPEAHLNTMEMRQGVITESCLTHTLPRLQGQ